MKFLLTRLFWRENSKAGALFGMLLGVVVLMVLAPVLALAYDVADMWIGVMKLQPRMMERYSMFLLALFCYGGLLILLFLRDAWATAFGCSKHVAGRWCLLGVVIPIAGALVPCALRMGRPKAAMFAVIGTLCFWVCVVIMALNAGYNMLFALALTCCCACWAAAVNGMPVGRRASAWAWAEIGRAHV